MPLSATHISLKAVDCLCAASPPFSEVEILGHGYVGTDLGMLLSQEVAQIGVEARDLRHRDVVRVALGGSVDDHHLLLRRATAAYWG